jgi:hypothetical protein
MTAVQRPAGVKWATRRRIWTIPNKYAAVTDVLGRPSYPLGTIIRYADTGSMYRWVGYTPSRTVSITGGKREPWEKMN